MSKYGLCGEEEEESWHRLGHPCQQFDPWGVLDVLSGRGLCSQPGRQVGRQAGREGGAYEAASEFGPTVQSGCAHTLAVQRALDSPVHVVPEKSCVRGTKIRSCIGLGIISGQLSVSVSGCRNQGRIFVQYWV